MMRWRKRDILISAGIVGCIIWMSKDSSEDYGRSIEGAGIPIRRLKNLPILREGRVKPLDSVARDCLIRYSARSTFVYRDVKTGKKIERQSATAWFSRVIFTPRETRKDKIFRVNNPEVLQALGMNGKSNVHSYEDFLLSWGILTQIVTEIGKKEDKDWSIIDKEFMRVYGNLIDYRNMTWTFAYAIEDFGYFVLGEPAAKKELGFSIDRQTFSYLELMEVVEKLRRSTHKELQQITRVYESFANKLLQEMTSPPLWMIPSPVHEEIRWFSPWEVFSLQSGKNLVKSEIQNIKIFAESYRKGDVEGFERSVEKFKKSIYERLQSTKITANKIWMEVLYNRMQPVLMSRNISMVCVLMLLFSLLLTNRFLQIVGTYGSIGSVLFGVVGLITRVYITGRPPVTNLFETFLFVSCAIGILGIVCEICDRESRGLSLLISGAATSIFLVISDRFAAEGDTIRVLIAVLDSNFWLSTHVLCICLGYSGVVLSGFWSQVYLLCRGFGERGASYNRIQMGSWSILAFGWIFTVLGTILGGIWADQSWGRFWGWDPKENGALMIILWVAMIYHARIGGIVNDLYLNVGCVLGIIVVMFAWFGINLLGVGLHSYGFTTGILGGLILYSSLQILLLFFLLYVIESRDRMKTFEGT